MNVKVEGTVVCVIRGLQLGTQWIQLQLHRQVMPESASNPSPYWLGANCSISKSPLKAKPVKIMKKILLELVIPLERVT